MESLMVVKTDIPLLTSRFRCGAMRCVLLMLPERRRLDGGRFRRLRHDNPV